MKQILVAAVEAKPYATAGGTSDVVGALSRELQQKGYDVRLVLPYYSTIICEPKHEVQHVADLEVLAGGRAIPAPVFVTDEQIYLIGGDPDDYFARVGRDATPLYPTLEDVSTDAGRLYAYFCRSVLELALEFNAMGWQPDIIHCHDWPMGLLPAMIEFAGEEAESLQDVPVIMTVHNMSDVVYQGGWFNPDLLEYAGLPSELFTAGQVRHEDHVNFMKTGIVFSDRVNTVSEGYAAEIRSGKAENYATFWGTRRSIRASGGLDAVWDQFGVDLIGIRNGIDDVYDPGTIGQGEDWEFIDGDWTANFAPADGQSVSGWAYSADDPEYRRKKRDLKCYLQDRCNRFLQTEFSVDADIPVVAVRSRLTEQKGFDLLLRGLQEWRSARPVQITIVAWGEERYASELRKLAAKHPGWIAFSDTWRAIPEPLHYAAADMFLMPSLFEPCGLPHMMALRYGTIPIVRRTGGLADVVEEFNAGPVTGNGFDFEDPEPAQMLQAVERALRLYDQQPDSWSDLLANAMQARDRDGQDFTWTTAADRYVDELYGPDL
jgi:starch synthase